MPENQWRMMPKTLWIWRSVSSRIVDGDTIDVIIDSGFHATRVERLRLLGINCPEMKEDAGKAAKEFTAEWIREAWSDTHWPLVIQTEKSDAFGRYLAYVWRVVDGRCLNDDLLDSGNAVSFRG